MHPSEKMKQESFCPLQRRMLAFTESEKSNQSFCRENLYFEAPWCSCSRKLCSPTEWPQKQGEFTVLYTSPPGLNTNTGSPWPSVELIFLEPEMKLYQVSIINGFEVVTRSTTDIAASSTTNTLIDPSSDPFYSVFQRSSFYRCKHRIHQRVHIYFRVMWILSRMKGSVELSSRAMRTIDFEAMFYQLCPVLI